MEGQSPDSLSLKSHIVAGLPIVNHFLDKLGIDHLLATVHPTMDMRSNVSDGQALGVLLRNIILRDRKPLYSHYEWAKRILPELLGLGAPDADGLNDDRIGRALEHLFDADRATLLTETFRRTVKGFAINLRQFNNDSTTLTLSGEYHAADGKVVRGKHSVEITYGHNKDHRPDLKQLLFILTVSADGAVPVHCRVMDGNVADVDTHIETWNMLRELSGRPDFTYVADCKLCSRKSLEYIDKQQGRFVTVLPRNRREDKWFRTFVKISEPPWEVAVSRPHPRRRSGSPDVWKVTEAQLPSKEGYRIIWVWNSLMAAEDADSRQARIEKAWVAVEQLKTRLEGKRCRIRTRERVDQEIERILKESGARRWVRIEVKRMEQAQFRQANKGRPGPNTKYRKITREKFSVGLLVDNDLVQSDAKSDGMFPLITNCRDLKPSEILAAYKSQPQLEKRFEQLKTVQDLAPVWLKNVTRIEALTFLYYIALLVHALIERELRKAMADNGIEMLPLYPEERFCRAPCTDRILELFEELQRHEIHGPKGKLQTVHPTLNPLQKQVLRLLSVPAAAFSGT